MRTRFASKGSVAGRFGWLVLCGAAVSAAPSAGRARVGGGDRAARVVTSLSPVVRIKGAAPARFALAERMKHFQVPGVSVAVFDRGRLAWAQGFGVTRSGTTSPVKADTMFQAASISKVMTATATLRLVDQGRLSLDRDVNAWLRSWKVPESPLTAEEKVTLRRIVSHTAGLAGHSAGGYAATEPLPSLPEILDGKKPAKTAAVRVDVVPGSLSRYSSGGVTIEQLLLTEVTGTPFPELLERLVLGPLGMRDSSYAQPLPADMAGRAAAAHDAAGAPLAPQLFPEMAAAGLWTTPSDLLRWATGVAAARAGRSNRLLARATAEAMLTARKGPFGLGPYLEGAGRAFHFGHEGWNEGFHSEVEYFPEAGQGAAVMVNGDGGRPLVREILYAIAAEYGWSDFVAPEIEVLAVDDAALERIVGTYETDQPVRITAAVTREGKRLFLDAPRLGTKTEVAFTKTDEIVGLDAGDHFAIVRGSDVRAAALQLGFIRLERRWAAVR